jgi:hypothetical protein
MAINSTCTEEELKKEAEELANIAIREKVAWSQIRSLFQIARTKGLVEFEVRLKYQMGRRDKTERRSIVSRIFGERVLSIIPKCQKQGLVTVLRYTWMLYDYVNMTNNSNTSLGHTRYGGQALSAELVKKIKDVIRQRTVAEGFINAKIEQVFERKISVTVWLNKFYGDRIQLRNLLVRALKAEIREIGNTFLEVRIEKG